MTWAKLDDTFGDDPRFMPLSRSHRLVWVEGLAWCAKHKTDGAIPRSGLRRITDDEDPEAAVVALVAAGLWTESDEGWEVVGYLDDQMSRAEVEAAKNGAAWRAERSRRHRRADHSLCIKGSTACRDGQITWAEWNDLQACGAPAAHVRALDTDQTRRDVDETRPEGGVESKAKEGGANAPAPPGGSQALARPEAALITIVDKTRKTGGGS